VETTKLEYSRGKVGKSIRKIWKMIHASISGVFVQKGTTDVLME